MTEERRKELRKAVHCLHITNCPTDGVELIVDLIEEALADSEAPEKVRELVASDRGSWEAKYAEFRLDLLAALAQEETS